MEIRPVRRDEAAGLRELRLRSLRDAPYAYFASLEREESLPLSPLSGSVFVFFNRGRDKVKLLWWDRTGFWLGYKRLERGRFIVPRHRQLSRVDLMLILEGVDLSVRRLKTLACERVG